MINKKESIDVCTRHSVDIESLKVKMDEREKLVTAQFEAIDKALTLARKDMERRLDGMNEFREQLSKQAATFVSAKEVDLSIKGVDQKLELMVNELEKKIELMVSELAKRLHDKIGVVIKDVTSLTACVSNESGSDKWKNHIVTVLIAAGVMLFVHYVFKL